jgi:hypothetical protein
MNKENVAYIHNGILFRHKEEQIYIVCRKIELEIIMLSETSQAQKAKNCMFLLKSGV